MIATLVVAAALTTVRPSPALDALGLGALHWSEPAAEIAQAPLAWTSDGNGGRAALSLVPGRAAVVTVGRCIFSARLMGAHEVLTHVEIDLSGGGRERCAQIMVSRLVARLGSPRPSAGQRSLTFKNGKVTSYAEQEPFWDGVGETASLTNWGPPISSLSLAATASGDEVVTVR